MSIKLAVFDMAGTTVKDDNYVGKAFQRAFTRNELSIDLEEVKCLMGYHKPLAIEMMLEKQGIEFDEELIQRIHGDFMIGMLEFYEYAPEVKPMADAEDVFLQLKEKGIRVALNTGFSKNIADTIVNRFQWREKGLIDDYIASDEVELGRPHAYMMHELMERAGVEDPLEVAKIGDTEVDMNEGRNVGCGIVIGVTTGAYTREQLMVYQPDHILDSLAGLPRLLS